MTKKKQRQRMKEYLVEGLRAGSASKVEHHTNNQFFQDFEYTLIEVDDSYVFLVDQEFTGNKFERLFLRTRGDRLNAAFIVLKDGKTFFRSAAQKNQFKRRYNLSLKEYSPEEIQRLMTLRPEEVLLSERNRVVQYYQPESERLQEGLVNVRFTPAQYDYSHLPAGRFRPSNRESTKRFICNLGELFQGPFNIQKPTERDLTLASFLVSAA